MPKKINIAYGSIEITDGNSFIRMPHQDFKKIEPSYKPIDREYTSGSGEVWEEGEYYLANFESYRTKWISQNSLNPAPSINWKQFRLFFLQNIAYNRMRQNTALLSGQIAAERIEAFLNKESLEWQVLAGQWGVFIDYVPMMAKPSAEEIAEWNTQAASAFMPFKFKNDGKMTLLAQP